MFLQPILFLTAFSIGITDHIHFEDLRDDLEAYQDGGSLPKNRPHVHFPADEISNMEGEKSLEKGAPWLKTPQTFREEQGVPDSRSLNDIYNDDKSLAEYDRAFLKDLQMEFVVHTDNPDHAPGHQSLYSGDDKLSPEKEQDDPSKRGEPVEMINDKVSSKLSPAKEKEDLIRLVNDQEINLNFHFPKHSKNQDESELKELVTMIHKMDHDIHDLKQLSEKKPTADQPGAKSETSQSDTSTFHRIGEETDNQSVEVHPGEPTDVRPGEQKQTDSQPEETIQSSSEESKQIRPGGTKKTHLQPEESKEFQPEESIEIRPEEIKEKVHQEEPVKILAEGLKEVNSGYKSELSEQLSAKHLHFNIPPKGEIDTDPDISHHRDGGDVEGIDEVMNEHGGYAARKKMKSSDVVLTSSEEDLYAELIGRTSSSFTLLFPTVERDIALGHQFCVVRVSDSVAIQQQPGSQFDEDQYEIYSKETIKEFGIPIIMAEFRRSHLPTKVTIGNNVQYGGFLNGPLPASSFFQVFVREIHKRSAENNVEHFQVTNYLRKQSNDTVPSVYLTAPDSLFWVHLFLDTVFVNPYIFCGLAVACTIFLILLAWFLLHRYRSSHRKNRRIADITQPLLMSCSDEDSDSSSHLDKFFSSSLSKGVVGSAFNLAMNRSKQGKSRTQSRLGSDCSDKKSMEEIDDTQTGGMQQRKKKRPDSRSAEQSFNDPPRTELNDSIPKEFAGESQKPDDLSNLSDIAINIAPNAGKETYRSKHQSNQSPTTSMEVVRSRHHSDQSPTASRKVARSKHRSDQSPTASRNGRSKHHSDQSPIASRDVRSKHQSNQSPTASRDVVRSKHQSNQSYRSKQRSYRISNARNTYPSGSDFLTDEELTKMAQIDEYELGISSSQTKSQQYVRRFNTKDNKDSKKYVKLADQDVNSYHPYKRDSVQKESKESNETINTLDLLDTLVLMEQSSKQCTLEEHADESNKSNENQRFMTNSIMPGTSAGADKNTLQKIKNTVNFSDAISYDAATDYEEGGMIKVRNFMGNPVFMGHTGAVHDELGHDFRCLDVEDIQVLPFSRREDYHPATGDKTTKSNEPNLISETGKQGSDKLDGKIKITNNEQKRDVLIPRTDTFHVENPMFSQRYLRQHTNAEGEVVSSLRSTDIFDQALQDMYNISSDPIDKNKDSDLAGDGEELRRIEELLEKKEDEVDDDYKDSISSTPSHSSLLNKNLSELKLDVESTSEMLSTDGDFNDKRPHSSTNNGAEVKLVAPHNTRNEASSTEGKVVPHDTSAPPPKPPRTKIPDQLDTSSGLFHYLAGYSMNVYDSSVSSGSLTSLSTLDEDSPYFKTGVQTCLDDGKCEAGVQTNSARVISYTDAAQQYSSQESLTRVISSAEREKNPYLDMRALRRYLAEHGRKQSLLKDFPREVTQHTPPKKKSFLSIRSKLSKVFKDSSVPEPGGLPPPRMINPVTGDLQSVTSSYFVTSSSSSGTDSTGCPLTPATNTPSSKLFTNKQEKSASNQDLPCEETKNTSSKSPVKILTSTTKSPSKSSNTIPTEEECGDVMDSSLLKEKLNVWSRRKKSPTKSPLKSACDVCVSTDAQYQETNSSMLKVCPCSQSTKSLHASSWDQIPTNSATESNSSESYYYHWEKEHPNH